MNNQQANHHARRLRINGLSLLEQVINELTEDLKKYVTQSNPNQYRVDKVNKLRAELYEVYRSISFLKYYDLWVDMERIMENTEQKDEVLSGHAILIRTKAEGNWFSIIDKQWYL